MTMPRSSPLSLDGWPGPLCHTGEWRDGCVAWLVLELFVWRFPGSWPCSSLALLSSAVAILLLSITPSLMPSPCLVDSASADLDVGALCCYLMTPQVPRRKWFKLCVSFIFFHFPLFQVSFRFVTVFSLSY
jgi:hypothetical protein